MGDASQRERAPRRRTCNRYRCSGTTQQALIDAAGQLFAAHGFESVGMRDIARKAGTSLQPTLYHFGSKSRLFAECVRQAVGATLGAEGLRVAAEGGESRDQALELLASRVAACWLMLQPSTPCPWAGAVLCRTLSDAREEGFDALMDELSPLHAWFCRTLAVVRPDWTPRQVREWYELMWAQITFHLVTGRAMNRWLALQDRGGESTAAATTMRIVRVMMGEVAVGNRDLRRAASCVLLPSARVRRTAAAPALDCVG